ncbi:guanine nucleotide binding protein, alpha subunit [Obelidium mucronatum]|nr:guanine nucleotide binding protein, alpha subunit [Obelidium mucronatum]
MGCAASAAVPEEVEASKTSKEIDREIEKEKQKKEAKLLLLGAGETGKSTILKQFKLIYGNGFSQEELRAFRCTILLQIINYTKILMTAMNTLQIPYGFIPANVDIEKAKTLQVPQTDQLLPDDPTTSVIQPKSKIDISDPISKAAIIEYRATLETGTTPNFVEEFNNSDWHLNLSESDNTLPSTLVASIKSIWNDSGIQYCFSRGSEYHLLDSCSYFLNEIDRISKSSYIPNDQDILNMRILTSTVTETRFTIDKLVFRVFDVGGQRMYRKAWTAYFDDVRAIIFLVAISAYDQKCSEDDATNRIIESLTVFNSICNKDSFKTTSIILFMNKIDLFKAKLESVPIANYFPEYKDSNNYENGSRFFSKKFLAANKNKDRSIYVHYTWATDTNQIKDVLAMVNEIILSSTMASFGLM